MPPIKLASTIPRETAFSERTSIAPVPALPTDRRTEPTRSSARYSSEATSRRLSSHPTGITNKLAAWITRPHGRSLPPGNSDGGGGNEVSERWTKPGDDPVRINVWPRIFLFPSLVVRGKPRQHSGQVGNVEMRSTGKMFA